MSANTLYVLLNNGCSIRVYQSFVASFKTFPIMPALCSMLSVTYYAQNYAGIIGWSLYTRRFFLCYEDYTYLQLQSLYCHRQSDNLIETYIN